MIALPEVPAVADAENETNDFRAWMKSMGFNAKQVTAAGEIVGMSPSLAGHSSRGLRDLTQTERLAMAAATAGLPAWSPESASEIEAVRTIYSVLKAETEASGGVSGTEAQAIQTINALIRSEAARIAAERSRPQGVGDEISRAIRDLLRAASLYTNDR